MYITRRTVLQAPAIALGASQTGTPFGRIKRRPSKSIAKSPISIGFETLDREAYDPAQTYPHVAELGVKWARCQTGWCRCEPRKGEFDFAWLDSIVDGLRAAGVQPWFNLGYGNVLYTPEAAYRTAVGWAPVFSAEAKTGWLRFVRKITEHFRSRVKHWEIWNEPNIAGFWRPRQPSPGDYVELVRMTAPVIRRVVPEAVIVGGAFSRIPFRYMEECFYAGMGQFIDKLSFHPYRPQPEWNYASEVHAMRRLVALHKPSIRLWQGENGAPSSSAKDSAGALANLAWSESSQAKWLLRRILSDLALDIELTSYFLIADIVNYGTVTGPTNRTNYKGILRGRDYTRKPSYYALQNVCALFDTETKRNDFAMQFERGPSPLDEMLIQSATFVRNNYPIYAYWYPAVLQEEYAVRRVSVSVWSGRDTILRDPVFVDLLSGEVRRPAEAKQVNGLWRFESVAMADYPILITDSAVI